MCVASDMNYTIVINGFVWIASLTYYALYARKWYTGPKTTAVNVSSDSSYGEAEPKHE